MNLSIIIPCYNSSLFLKKMLDSIEINFADIKYEVIIVDDRSKKSEFKKILELVYSFDKTKLFMNGGAKGAGSCRNMGLKYATGKWILFADSDDHFLVDSGKTVSRYFDSGADLVLFPPMSTDSKGETGNRHLTFRKEFEHYRNSHNLNDLRFRLPYVWSKLFRREFIQVHKIVFDEVMVNNDVMFSVKCGHKAERIEVSSVPIYSWDYNSNSLTTAVSKERFLIRINVIVSLNKYLKNETPREIYKTYRPSAIKPLVTSLIRYKYGTTFTLRLAHYLLSNRIKLIKRTDLDLSKVRNFMKNNSLYSSPENETS